MGFKKDTIYKLRRSRRGSPEFVLSSPYVEGCTIGECSPCSRDGKVIPRSQKIRVEITEVRLVGPRKES